MSNDERNPKFQCRTTLRSVASGFVIQIGEAWFMESHLSFFRMHWDHEPPWVDPFIPNELRVRFMESAFSIVSVSEPRKERKIKGYC